MVDAEGVDSNHLFITLSQWNEILQDKSIPNSSDYPRKLDTSEKPPKTKKAQAKTYSVDSVKRIGEQFAFRVANLVNTGKLFSSKNSLNDFNVFSRNAIKFSYLIE